MPRTSGFFSPILAGATFKDRVLACLGALLGIGLTGLICGSVLGGGGHLPLIVAPMGASAVLLFTVPASPLAQPWPIIFGNTISAASGVLVGKLFGDQMLAAGLAVSVAIVAMSVTRSLHPPGGAAALTAIVGGAAVKDMGFLFALVPVALNSLVLVGLGVIFHRVAKHNYPHRPVAEPANVHRTQDLPPQQRSSFTGEDIDSAIGDLHEQLDIDRSDLAAVLRLTEQRSLVRNHGQITCADIMSRDVIKVAPGDSLPHARALMLDHHLTMLPVVDADDMLAGSLALQELASLPDDAKLPVSVAETASPDDPVISLLPRLTDGKTHEVIIIDDSRHVRGIVSQTDLLAALGQMLLGKDAGTTASP